MLNQLVRPGHRWRVSTAAVAAVVVLALAACGSGGGATDTGGKNVASVDTAAIDAVVASATKEVTWNGPTTPVTPPPGKKIFLMSGGNASPSAKLLIDEVAPAIEKLGWDVTTFDGKLDPAVWAEGLGQALNEKPDGVIMFAVTVDLVKNQIAALRKAGIPVIAMGTTEPASDTGSSYTISGYRSDDEGKFAAAMIAQNSGGDAKIATITNNEYGTVKDRYDALLGYLDEYCPGCEIVTTQAIQATDLYTPQMVAQIAAVLQANPSVDYLWMPYDDATVSALEAIKVAGKQGEVHIVSYEANPQILEEMAKGDDSAVIADVAGSRGWLGYAGLDTMIRILAGQEGTIDDTVTNTYPSRMFTPKSLPNDITQYWNGDADYQAEYFKLWGLS
jgi:ribose transport system substrate-binding protein